MYLLNLEFSSFLNICPGVGLLDHRVALVLVFKRTSILFSIALAPIYIPTNLRLGFPGGTSAKETSCQHRRHESSIPGSEDPLEKGMAALSTILAWRIPWTEKSGGLQSMGSQRVRHDCTT